MTPPPCILSFVCYDECVQICQLIIIIIFYLFQAGIEISKLFLNKGEKVLVEDLNYKEPFPVCFCFMQLISEIFLHDFHFSSTSKKLAISH
jgi:hypothetical protein